MTPETAQAIGAIATIVEKLGALPVGSMFIVIVFGPWIFSFIMSRVQEKRFDAMKEMYKNNVKLVESFDKLASGLNDVVTLNTAKWSEAIDKINSNQYCPLARVKKVRRRICMGEIARLKTEIQARRFRALEIAAEIDRKVKDIKEALAGYPLTKPENLRLAMVAEISSELERLQADYLQLQREIERAEKELQ
jgi:excinuclease UvrABC ATPase subunit